MRQQLLELEMHIPSASWKLIALLESRLIKYNESTLLTEII
jgi:hypothetical protein